MNAASSLRAYQKTNRLTQRALAEHLQVSEAQISLWLSGKRGPSLATAVQVEERTGGAVPATSWLAKKRHARRFARSAS